MVFSGLATSVDGYIGFYSLARFQTRKCYYFVFRLISHALLWLLRLSLPFYKEYLDFLVKQGLVEERIVRRNNIVYACTARGTGILKAFRELNQALPIIEGENKNPLLLY